MVEDVEDEEGVPSKRICFMYKCGDDLRQDSLVLNIIKVKTLFLKMEIPVYFFDSMIVLFDPIYI